MFRIFFLLLLHLRVPKLPELRTHCHHCYPLELSRLYSNHILLGILKELEFEFFKINQISPAFKQFYVITHKFSKLKFFKHFLLKNMCSLLCKVVFIQLKWKGKIPKFKVLFSKTFLLILNLLIFKWKTAKDSFSNFFSSFYHFITLFFAASSPNNTSNCDDTRYSPIKKNLKKEREQLTFLQLSLQLPNQLLHIKAAAPARKVWECRNLHPQNQLHTRSYHFLLTHPSKMNVTCERITEK